MPKQLKRLVVACAAWALLLACNKQPDANNSADPPTQTTAGTNGMAGSSNPSEAAGGAADEATQRKGERGSSCNSDADCADELSCIVTRDCPAGVNCANKSCQPSNFGLMGSGKSCVIHDCSTKADCCGDMPETAPAKCNQRTSVCSTPNIAGCTVKVCTTTLDCGPGTCTPAVCSANGAACDTTADCAANTCDPQTLKCTLTQVDCSVTSCIANVCPTHYCNCKNPDYLPSSPLCTDPDCEGICGFTCSDERCVVDKHCGSDAECGVATPYCTAGACVECRNSEDCDKQECVAGHCGPECESDTQCKLFEACQSGNCTYVGCRSDRECVLQAGKASSTQDPRLAKCQITAGVGTCVYPCEIDAQCAASDVCLDGTCQYIGCETDGECKTIAGLHDLPAPTPERPWTTSAECRPDNAAQP